MCPETSEVAGTSFGRENTHTAVQPASGALPPPLSARKKGTHMASVKKSATTHLSRVPPIEVALWLISYTKRCPAHAHWTTSAQTRNIPSALTRLFGRSRAREPIIAHTPRGTTSRHTKTKIKPRNLSDEHTRVMRSCRSLEGLR